MDPSEEDLAILLQDKEALKSTLSSSNDMHVGKLISTEDSMRDDFVKAVRSCSFALLLACVPPLPHLNNKTNPCLAQTRLQKL